MITASVIKGLNDYWVSYLYFVTPVLGIFYHILTFVIVAIVDFYYFPEMKFCKVFIGVFLVFRCRFNHFQVK